MTIDSQMICNFRGKLQGCSPGDIYHITENSVEKGENAGYQHFLFPTIAIKSMSFVGCLTSRLIRTDFN